MLTTEPMSHESVAWLLEAVKDDAVSKHHGIIAEAQRRLRGEMPSGMGLQNDVAQLRHLYLNLVSGNVMDKSQAKRIADGLLAPVIKNLEKKLNGL